LFLDIRNVPVDVTSGDFFVLIAGGATAGAFWAVIGLGVGAIVRSQVPALVGILVWVLFVENVLTSGIASVGKFAPATLGRAIAGATSGTLNAPALGALLLALYAVVAIVLGWLVTTRRDFA
jgi:hypothetical protein